MVLVLFSVSLRCLYSAHWQQKIIIQLLLLAQLSLDFVFCLFSVFYFVSCISHQPAKKVLNIIDHISIYFLIAGTYTPFLLNYMMNKTGITLLSILWGLTLVGIFFKIFLPESIISYLHLFILGYGMDFGVWRSTVFLCHSLPVLTMIIIGGALYTIGTLFYLWEKLYYHHVIWHLFVLSAAICHYVAVLLMV